MEITIRKFIEEDLTLVKDLLDYDPKTGNFIWKLSVSKNKAGTPAGSIRKDGYVKIQINRRPIKAHRIAWAIHYNQWPDEEIDHINGDRSDNSIVNLRLATRDQNNHNRRPQKGSSNYKGVQWHKSAKKWIARAYQDGVRRHLGVFNTEKEAAIAYNKAALSWYGEYSVLNDVKED